MAAEALEQSVLESKDKDQFLAIAKALGLKATRRTKKSDIIDSILETTGSTPAVERRCAGPAARAGEPWHAARTAMRADADAVANGRCRRRRPMTPLRRRRRRTADRGRPSLDGEPPAEWELDLAADSVRPPSSPPPVGVRGDERRGVSSAHGARLSHRATRGRRRAR